MQTQLREKQLSRTNKIVTGKLKTEKDEVSDLVPRSCFFSYQLKVKQFKVL